METTLTKYMKLNERSSVSWLVSSRGLIWCLTVFGSSGPKLSEWMVWEKVWAFEDAKYWFRSWTCIWAVENDLPGAMWKLPMTLFTFRCPAMLHPSSLMLSSLSA